MTDGHLQGRQKLRAASRAGAAAPGPSGPAPALPARGGRRGSRRPSGQARLAGAAGSVGLGHRPGETRASAAKRTKNRRKPAPRARPGAPRPRGSREPGLTGGPGRRPKRDKTSRLLGRKAQVPASPGPSVEVGSLRGPRPAGWRPSPICPPARCTRPALSRQGRLRPGAFPGRKPCEPRGSGGPHVDPG